MGEVNQSILRVILGTESSLDLPRMSIQNRDEAVQFIFTYGYDLSDYKDSEVLWKTHRSAVEILEEEILDVGEEVPAEIRNREELGDLSQLLIIASAKDKNELQKYTCALLRVMHIIIQLENDLFTSFTDDIQYQILRPIKEHIVKDEKGKTFLGEHKEIELLDFSVKPFKQTKSGVIKLLAKNNKLAMTLLDRVGLRFVTHSIYDIFLVIRYLLENHLISFPQTVQGQSKNLICPVEMFNEIEKEFKTKKSPLDKKTFDEALRDKLKDWQNKGNLLTSHNRFSSKDFKFIKFISRRFLKIDRGPNKEPLKFFYPFEVQIVDKKTFEENEKSSANHLAYKERQRRAARRRVLGLEPSLKTDS